jgi:hypothetical protein
MFRGTVVKFCVTEICYSLMMSVRISSQRIICPHQMSPRFKLVSGCVLDIPDLQ